MIPPEAALPQPAGPAGVDHLLVSGGLLVYPTESFYALGCVPGLEAPVSRLLALKGRPDGKPLPLIAADVSAARKIACLEDQRLRQLWERLAQAFWPGPLTLVVPAVPGLAAAVTGGTGEVGVRVCGLQRARELAGAAGGILIATSANRSGGAPAAVLRQVDANLLTAVDRVIDGGTLAGGLPSTLLRLGGGEPLVLRRGAVTVESLAAVLGASPMVKGDL